MQIRCTFLTTKYYRKFNRAMDICSFKLIVHRLLTF